jgi:RND family efflux transporter MFP subunit
MKKIIYIIAALALIAIVVIKLKSNQETTAKRVYHYDKEQAINVQVDTLRPEIMENNYNYSGTFEPNKETRVSSEIQGKINSLLVDVGSRVKKGEPLIHLDNTLLKLQLQSVEIQIEGHESDVNRYTVLDKADAIQGVQLEKAELGLKSARVQRATLIEQINKTTVTAPFNGIVTAKLTEEGAFASPGIPLLQITDISLLKFTITVPEDELYQFEANRLYDIAADVYPSKWLPAKVIMAGSKANMGNSFPVQFSVKNSPDYMIKAGMFGKVRPGASAEKNENTDEIISIPSSSVIGTNIQPQVYIVKNGKAHIQNITISNRFQNRAVVSDGLQNGDIIVVNGFVNLFDGANVNFN